MAPLLEEDCFEAPLASFVYSSPGYSHIAVPVLQSRSRRFLVAVLIYGLIAVLFYGLVAAANLQKKMIYI